jgi:hypothetical protein
VKTINIYFNEVMRIIYSLAVNIIKSKDPKKKYTMKNYNEFKIYA